LKYKSKKDEIQSVHFEDKGFPSILKDIRSHYWYRNEINKRISVSFKTIIKNSKERGCEIIKDCNENKYYIHYPIEYGFYMFDDKRNENQVSFLPNNNCISLDPGVRKFLVGYDPNGKIVFFGEKARIKIAKMLLEVDKTKNKYIWKKIKNMINEMHWKTINYLLKNYDTILLPSFEVSEMVKGKRLNRMVKRLMLQFSFFVFKQRLLWKASLYNKKVIIVDESYTSKTCTGCFSISKTLGSKEIYNCKQCNISIDRDICGSRNILIKNLKLTSN